MLQPAFVTTTASALTTARVARPLQALLNTIRLQTVAFNAQDVYSMCVMINSGDTLKLMQDAEIMRGLQASFQRSQQSVLSPFQVTVCNETFRKAGIRAPPKDIVMPDDEQASPESLLNVLISMIATKNRDERKIAQTLKMMKGMIDDFVPAQLVAAVRHLSFLQCTDATFMSLLGKRLAETHDDVNTFDLAGAIMSLCLTKGVSHPVLVSLLEVANQRAEDMKADDMSLVLQGLIAVGPRYRPYLTGMVSHALENAETLDVNCLGYFLSAFAALEYKDRSHMEIFADAIIEKCHELTDRQLVATMQAIQTLGIITAPLFDAFAERAAVRAAKLDPRNIAALLDVCSTAPGNTDVLMRALLDRIAECAMLMNANQLGDVLEIIANYPPAREHSSVVAALGKSCKRRLEGMGPPPLAKAVYGLSSLGFSDADFYIDAALVQLRWGFKDYSIMEPILLGLVSCGCTEPTVVKLLASHIPSLCRQMTVHQVERCNMYLNRLQCEDERAYRGLAERIKVFTKEVTPEMPQEIQALLERAAASQAEYEAQKEAKRAARIGGRGRGGYGG